MLGLLAAVAAPAAAEARSFSIDRFAVTIQVHDDASLSVRETITFNFRGRHQGIYRTIPVRAVRNGLDVSLRLEEIYVYDEHLRRLRTEISHPDGRVKIKAWVPEAADASRTVNILYRVRRGLLTLADHDELYWNATGDEWDAPITEAEAIVALPASVPPATVRTIAYTGPRGVAGRDYSEDRIENMVLFRSTRPLRPREGITVVVGWPHGHVTGPSVAQRARWMLADTWPLALPMATFFVTGLLWVAYGRDPASNRSVKPEYEPPPGMIPAEAGTLVHELAEPREVIATIVDLAVRGYLHVEQVTDAFGATDFLFKRLKPIGEERGFKSMESFALAKLFGESSRTSDVVFRRLSGHPELKPLELFVFAKLFGPDWSLNLRLLSEIRRDYGSVFPPIRDAMYRSLVAQRLFPSSPGRVRAAWAAAGLVALAAAGFIWMGEPGSSAGLGPLLPIGIAASGLVIAAFGWIMPRKTWRGARTLVLVRGFQEFLERAEKDRLERMPADTLHRWLPWAIALGVTDRWIFSFDGLKVDSPTWYTGPDYFSLTSYHRDLTFFGTRTIEAITGRGGPGGGSGGGWSSGESGFSGGSSGGGAGGGGGGTF